jgi:hypothetical protein
MGQQTHGQGQAMGLAKNYTSLKGLHGQIFHI